METERKDKQKEQQQKINLFEKTVSLSVPHYRHGEKDSMMTLFFYPHKISLLAVYLTFFAHFKRGADVTLL